MQRILPETDLERRLMSLGAPFIEENQVLDELFQVLGHDLAEDQEMSPETKEQVLDEIGEYFFRLDMNYGPEIKADCIGILEEFWSVVDRESCQRTLENIRTQGHRTKFNVLRTSLPVDGSIDAVSMEKFRQIFNFDLEDGQDLQMSEADYSKLALWVQRTNKYLKDSGILAWDASRYIHLVRLSFVAGYLSDIQAWSEILKLAPIVEGKFENWMDFSQSFLIGRTFWSGADDPRVKNICEKLLGHPASPWHFIAWT
ncbi:DUF1266 domain-containing protein [Bdellovibrio bacteriovorus]|uniref:DUF1266 domain-containing protein n=1 Tax=Bdellovibrio bacteriovorus TaxID=959 RepID=UPI0021CF9F70|nr:DUF1266 domain-containing protein [Bdellovibrio bacteriovorus]UXR64339.1 DUF1266 domain-containing protein [Bdellovibrio bacteriovorus]